jgi:hypothetical protein
LGVGLLFGLGCFLLDLSHAFSQRLKCIYCKTNVLSLYLCGFEDKVSHISKVALDILAIAEAMPCSSTPETNVRFKPRADSLAYSTVCTGGISALPPLVVEFRVFILGYDVFAFGFFQFQILAYLVDNYPAFLALKDV